MTWVPSMAPIAPEKKVKIVVLYKISLGMDVVDEGRKIYVM